MCSPVTSDSRKASNIAYVSPSLTTWVGMDPSFRIYEMDHWDRPDSTFAVLDHHTYTANVHIPKSEKLRFSLEYSARADYNLPTLSPRDWAKMINRWTAGQDDETFQKYYKNKYHQNLNHTCDDACKAETLCYLNMAVKSDEAESLLCT